MNQSTRNLVSRLPFAKSLNRKYLTWRGALSGRRASVGRTSLNILDAFPAFVAYGWGLYKPRARLTIQAINQTIPAFLRLPFREDRDSLQIASFPDFVRSHVDTGDAAVLKSLFDRYGSDKANQHDYYLGYACMLGAPGKVAKVFEVGLGTNNIDVVSTMGKGGRPGASLRAFRDYCPNALIYGADYDQRVLFKEERISTFFVDQTDEKTFQPVGDALGGDFDLMIDDGLHAPNANLHSLAFFLPRIRVGGWAVIEDISPASEAVWQLVSRILPAQYDCWLLKSGGELMFAVKRVS